MSNRARKRTSGALLGTKAFELSMAAPQVVAHRLTRMARAGGRPSAADQREMLGMVSEKVIAFNASWAAMYAQMLIRQTRVAQQVLAGAWRGPLGLAQALHRSTVEASGDVTRVLHSGLAPVHAKAMANVRRLAKSRKA